MGHTQEEYLSRTGLHGPHANGKRITRIGLPVGFPDLALQQYGIVLAQEFELGGIGQHTGLDLDFRLGYGTRDAQELEVHASFPVQKAVYLVERHSRIAQALLIDDRREHHAALDELHFCFGRGRNIQEGTHFAKRLGRLVALNIHLQKDITLVRGTHPHGSNATCKKPQNKENRQELPMRLRFEI